MLTRLKEWFVRLTELGPDFGYYPEPQKTIVVVEPKDQAEAHLLFDNLGVTVLSGRFLGTFIGDHEGTLEYVHQKVQGWIHCIERLTKAAESQPQAAQMALTKSLQFEWAYLQRVVPNCSEAFAPLRDTINKKCWPTVFGRSISEQEKTLFSLPTRKGELGISDTVESAQHFHSASIEGTAKIVSSIKGEEKFSVLEHRAMVVKAQAKLKKHRMEQDQRKLEAALEQMDTRSRRVVLCAGT